MKINLLFLGRKTLLNRMLLTTSELPKTPVFTGPESN